MVDTNDGLIFDNCQIARPCNNQNLCILKQFSQCQDRIGKVLQKHVSQTIQSYLCHSTFAQSLGRVDEYESCNCLKVAIRIILERT